MPSKSLQEKRKITKSKKENHNKDIMIANDMLVELIENT